MKDSVGKWYRDGSKHLNVIPPHSAWDGIEKTMEDWPKHWYQSNFDDIQTAATASNWESISAQLQIQRNAKVGYRNYLIKTASIALLLILLPLWTANVPFLLSTKQAGIAISNTPIATNTVPASSTTADQEELQQANSTVQAVDNSSQPIKVELNNTSIDRIVSSEPVSVDALESQKTFSNQLEKLTSKPFNLLNEFSKTQPTFTLVPTQSIRYSEPHEIIASNDRKWYVGPTAIMGRSTLRNPLSFREDVISMHSINLTYGISATRVFDRNAFTVDLLFNDTKSQHALMTSEDVSTSLKHVTLAMQYERSLPILKNMQDLRPELYFGAGVFGSYLSNASVMSSLHDSYIGSFTYKSFDFGGVLTAGVNFDLSKRLRMGVSARMQSGFVNLFEGREKVPSDLFRTQSLSIGVQAKLSYAL